MKTGKATFCVCVAVPTLYMRMQNWDTSRANPKLPCVFIHTELIHLHLSTDHVGCRVHPSQRARDSRRAA
jgi:hypothetical protein